MDLPGAGDGMCPGEMLILIVPSGDGQGLVVDLCRQHTMT